MKATGSLSARRVETAPAGMHSDGGGLYLVVSENGRRRWSFIYRRGNKRTELGLGAYPDVPLARAREKAAANRALLADGLDPKQAKKAHAEPEKRVPSFGEAADEFIAAMEPQFRNSKHVGQWKMTLRDYAGPLREKQVNVIDTEAVLSVLTPVWGKMPETASRLRGRIERVLDYAKVKGWRLGENPALWRGHLDKLLPKRQRLSRGHHAAMPYDDVPPFLKALREHRSTAGLALEFTILLAARTNETLNAQWSEFDLEKAFWTIPAGRMKAGREHRVPLSPQALDIIQRCKKVEGSPYIFPGQSKGKPLSGMAMTMMLRRMKLDDFTVHGFRSSFRDWAAENTNFPNEVCEAALAHVIGNKAEAAYRRGDLFEKRRKLMEAWANFCDQQGKASVVPFAKTR